MSDRCCTAVVSEADLCPLPAGQACGERLDLIDVHAAVDGVHDVSAVVTASTVDRLRAGQDPTEPRGHEPLQLQRLQFGPRDHRHPNSIGPGGDRSCVRRDDFATTTRSRSLGSPKVPPPGNFLCR